MADPQNPAFQARPKAQELNPIPKFGDGQLLPKPDKVRPSAERMPFSPNGTLIPEGPDPRTTLPADFLSAPDIEGLPWTRERYDAWTTASFRQTVRTWLIYVFLVEAQLIGWDITEKGTGPRMGHLRLRPESRHLVIGLTKRLADGGSGRVEVSLTFPQKLLNDAIVVRTVLDSNAWPSLQQQLALLV
jgi:hypothetical protein